MVVHVHNPNIREGRKILRLRSVWATQQDPAAKNKIKQKTKQIKTSNKVLFQILVID
jgi:hypothetical protein